MSGSSARAGAAPRAPVAAASRVSVETHAAVLSSLDAARAAHVGPVEPLSAAVLSQPLQPASEAQRELLVRVLASDSRFKDVHDAAHEAGVLTAGFNPDALHRALELRGVCYSPISAFYNSDEWRSLADSREYAAAPPRAAARGECTFCPGIAARVLMKHDSGGCCYVCMVPTTRAYMGRTKNKPIPLCSANCPRAPWAYEAWDEEDEDEQGRLVQLGEVTERSYSACHCGLERDPEDVTVRPVPARASGDAEPLRRD